MSDQAILKLFDETDDIHCTIDYIVSKTSYTKEFLLDWYDSLAEE